MKKNYFISAGYQPKCQKTTLYNKEKYNVSMLPVKAGTIPGLEQQDQNALPNKTNGIGFEKVNQGGTRSSSLNNDLFAISPLTTTTTQFPPAIRQWVNSVYNFNKNYLKNLPAVDNVVNNIIKSFFTINPLAYNPGGKKSRLLQRRYKRLSLNTILASKSEIKHSNDKVYITVYLFNKKKRSLLNKLNQIYDGLGFTSFKNFSFGEKAQDNNKSYFNMEKYKRMLLKYETINQKKIYRIIKGFGKKVTNNNKKTRGVADVAGVASKRRGNKFSSLRNKSLNTFLPKNLGSAPAFTSNFKKKVFYYKNLNNLTLNSINKFFTLALLKSKSLAKANSLQQAQALESAHLENIQGSLEKASLSSQEGKLVSPLMSQDTALNFSPAQSLFILQALDLLKSKSGEVSSLEKYIYGDVNVRQLSLKNKKYYTALRNSIVKKNLSSLAHSWIVRDYYYALNKYKLYRGDLSSETRTAELSLQSNDVSHNVLDTQNNKAFSFKGRALSTHWQEAMLKIRSIQLPSAKAPSNLEKLLKENSDANSQTFSNHSTLHAKSLDLFYLRKNVNKGNLKNTLYFRSLSMYKLRALYKLFTLHNSIHNVGLTNSEENTISNLSYLYSSKIIWNTYKLLKKSLIVNIQSKEIDNNNSDKHLATDTSNGKNIEQGKGGKINSLALKKINTFHRYRNMSINRLNGVVSSKKKNNNNNSKTGISITKNFLKTSLSILQVRKRKKSFNSIQTVMKNIILIKNINKIDRFFNKYKNLTGFLDNNSYCPSTISSIYKLEYIKEFLDKELVYLYYVKLLSFNNAIFKNWFLNSLKNIISKIYNKKVVFNLINLKYIHLNTDILLQAIKIRLRNFKKNRVTKVLRKAIKLVKLSKINIYTYDIHSPTYKYIAQHFNKFKGLNLEIFKPYDSHASAGIDENSDLTPYYTPLKIRRLNHVQASTINFIKYKSVFGVRLQGSGRLTKRSTASRSIFKFRYKGSLKNNDILSRTVSSVILNNNRISNIQFTKISSKTRNGAYGLKGWINNN